MAEGMLKKSGIVLLGIIFVLVGIWTYTLQGWLTALVTLVKGGLGLVLALIGLLTILIGWSS